MITPVDDVPRAFSDAVGEAFSARPGPRFALVLSGGPTAQECYEVLATAGGIDWAVVDIFVGDERLVPPDDVDANQRLIKEALLDRVGPVGSFSPMPTAGPVGECVAAYQRTMSDLVTGPGIDVVDINGGVVMEVCRALVAVEPGIVGPRVARGGLARKRRARAR